VILGRRANCIRATAVRKRDVRAALKGIDTALEDAGDVRQARRTAAGPQHNHLHLHAEVPSREEAIETPRECLEVFAPHLLATGPLVPIDVDRSPEGEPPGEGNGT
jgi:hypothetical protein